MFTCEKRGKEFTEKTNLLRHMKTHVDSSQTYSCSICDKEFSRADNRKRHEAPHGQRRSSPARYATITSREWTLFTGICRPTREEWTKHHRPDQAKPPRGNCHLQLDPAQSSNVPCHHHQRPTRKRAELHRLMPESSFQTIFRGTKLSLL